MSKLNNGISQTISGVDGLDYNPGSDINTDIITVGVTGTPRIYWDETYNAFRFTQSIEAKSINIGSGDNLYLAGNAAYIRARAADDGYLVLQARDNGVGSVEVARLQGAADPYLQATLPMVLKPIVTGSLPATPVEGMIAYDATLNKLVVYTGAAWETVTSS